MRTFKENFIIRYSDDKFMMINLISFRRKVISIEQYNLLQGAHVNPNDADEKVEEFISSLYNEKQLLSDVLIQWYDEQRRLTIPQYKRAITNITINLTYDCNFKCEYCYQQGFNYSGKYLTEQDINRIYEYIKEYNSMHGYPNALERIVISGGESLLEKNIKSINRILEVFNGVKVKIFTNGVNILPFSDRLDYTKVKEAQISLDGPEDVIRNVNNNSTAKFENIIEGAKLLKKLGVDVSLVAMITKKTMDYLPTFLELLESTHILSDIPLRFSFAINHNEPYGIEQKLYSIDEYLDMKSKVQGMIAGKKNIALDVLYELATLANIIGRKANERIDGNVFKCNIVAGMPLLFGPDHKIYWCACTNMERSIGDFNQSPMELDKSKILKELLERNVFTVEKCRKCIYRYVCSTGCPLYPIHQKNMVNCPSCGIIASPQFEEKAEQFLAR